mmetsp:Transcript_25573/g.85718  ORF Transcript_25573/g.85718 Transcript_25573/m.85718 type:complete len:158 (-) Transcript_25573:138-611(-)
MTVVALLALGLVGPLAPSAGGSLARSHLAQSPRPVPRSSPSMGLLDAFKNAFANAPFDKRSARASHILFKGPGARDMAADVKARIEQGELTFANAAREYSACPSRSRGGSLGTFSPGQMVPAFDRLVFDPATQIDEIATVDTNFGTHLVKVEARTGF